MGNWPGAEADAWWASLPVKRREQIHRMMSPKARAEPLPKRQLALPGVQDFTPAEV